MPAKFSPAPEVERIAGELVPKHHRHLLETGVRVEYLFSDKMTSKNGKEVYGTARKVTGLAAYFARRRGAVSNAEANKPLFLIVIARPAWDALKPAQRVALVDHELMHLEIGLDLQDKVVLDIRGHDLEEFTEIIERHGCWMPDHAEFLDAIWDAGQLDLFTTPAPEARTVAPPGPVPAREAARA